MRQNAFAAGALPRTPVGELTALSKPRSWSWEIGMERAIGTKRERTGEGGEGKGEG